MQILPEAIKRLLKKPYLKGLMQRSIKEIHSPMANELVKLYSFDSMLEVGSGAGTLLAELQTRKPKAKLLGIDPEIENLKDGQKLIKSRYGKNPTILPLAFSEFSKKNNSQKETFDLIFCYTSFHHLDPDEQNSFFTDSHKLLKDGGELLVIDYTKNSDFEKYISFQHERIAKLPFILRPPIEKFEEEFNEKFLSTAGFSSLLSSSPFEKYNVTSKNLLDEELFVQISAKK